jgi:hypothetical protein
MRPTTADDNVFDFNALLHPGTFFEHPKDVVCHTGRAHDTLHVFEGDVASHGKTAKRRCASNCLRDDRGRAPMTDIVTDVNMP